jgi:hypothetical protein
MTTRKAGRTPAQEASAYFNSLPIEQRKKLAPLLECYRRMGIEEADRAIRAVSRKLDDRAREITAASFRQTNRQTAGFEPGEEVK